MLFGIEASARKSVPDAPTIGTATDVGTARAYNNGAATVTFTAPSFNGKLPITSYTVTSSPGGFTASGASSPLTVTGLQSSTSYTFTVTATNAIGTSSASVASNSITATTVPQAPTIGTAADGGTGTSATVTYTAGATGGKAVSAYTATSSPGSLTGTGASPITVSGLTTGTSYTFTVTATNANGTSTASSASNSVTPATPSSYDSIATINPTSGATTVTFSSIPQTYKSLQFRFILKTNNGPGFNTGYGGSMLFNGVNSGSLYSAHNMQGTGTSAIAGSSVDVDSLALPNIMAGSFIASLYAGGTIDVLDYTSTSKNKTIRGLYGVDPNNGGTNWRITLTSGFLRNTSAITSITFNLDNLASGSSIALYGIK
jgi:hypothetical protein